MRRREAPGIARALLTVEEWEKGNEEDPLNLRVYLYWYYTDDALARGYTPVLLEGVYFSVPEDER